MRLLTSFLILVAGLSAQTKSPLRFEISWLEPMNGHVVLIVSTASGEPRNSVSEGLGTQQMFDVDVDGTRAAVSGC